MVLGAHSPWCLPFGLDIPHTPWEAPSGQPGGEETGAAAAGKFPSAPKGLFHFEKILLLNPATSSYMEGPVLSHSPPLQLDWGLSGSGLHTAQFSTLPGWCPWCLWVYHTLSLFPYCDVKQLGLLVLLKCCLAGEGALSSALSQESCCRPGRHGPGAAAALVPALVPGTFLS